MSEPTDPKVRRHRSWAGVKAGDPVMIDNPRARRASFEFVAFVEHLGNGETWVEVVGGRRGDRKLWSFRPEQVFPLSSKGAPPSLDAAPQLPLG
jgi:hypothetical protein